MGVSVPVNVKKELGATGSAPVFGCRAWVNFNGTGTLEIRAAGNVSSVTDNGVGSYTVNFSNAMPDSNFCVTATCTDDDLSFCNNIAGHGSSSTYTENSVQVMVTVGGSSNKADAPRICIAVFR